MKAQVHILTILASLVLVIILSTFGLDQVKSISDLIWLGVMVSVVIIVMVQQLKALLRTGEDDPL